MLTDTSFCHAGMNWPERSRAIVASIPSGDLGTKRSDQLVAGIALTMRVDWAVFGELNLGHALLAASGGCIVRIDTVRR